MPSIKALYIYPVKSCQPISLESLKMTPFGFENDRRWAIIDEVDGQIESQYLSHPRLATIIPAIIIDDQGHQCLCLSAPSTMETTIKIKIRTEPDPSRRRVVSKVSRVGMEFAEDEGDAAGEWLDSVLAREDREGDHFRLVWCPPDAGRELYEDPQYGSYMRKGEATGFADNSQYHMANEKSLEDLNRVLKEKHGNEEACVSVTRFRRHTTNKHAHPPTPTPTHTHKRTHTQTHLLRLAPL